MNISFFLTLAVVVMFIVDIIKGADLLPPVVLSSIIVASILNCSECYYLALALPLRYPIYIVLQKSIVKKLGLKYVISPFIQPLAYVVSGIVIGLVAQKFLALPLDPWTAKTIFIFCSYLAISLTISPSLSSLSSPLKFLLITELDSLRRVLYTVALLVGAICILFVLPYIKYYIVIPLASIFILRLFRNRIEFIWRHLAVTLFFIQVLMLSIIITS